MNKLIIVFAAIIAGVFALRLFPGPRRRLAAAARRRMVRQMERMMAALPASSPPKLVVSVLPRLSEQNDQIIAMLRDQNELLRRRLQQAS